MKLREWIYGNGLTVNDFCKLISTHRTTLFRWRKGTKTPGPRSMFKINQVTKGEFKKPEDILD